MQDTVEVRRITKNPDLGIIDRVRKVIEWRDVISIEEGGSEIAEELGENDLVLITLSYTEIVVMASYSKITKKWLEFREFAKAADGKVSNIMLN
tara:strand:+ start:1077 stop:1358 length:282 start_codon:yes stop_codon:yes gene_type:complete